MDDAIAGEVDIHRVKFYYHEKRYVYPMSFTPDFLEVARRCATWMANYFWRRGLYEVQYAEMSAEERAACIAHRQQHGHAGGMPRGAKIEARAAAQRWLAGERAYAPELVREPMFVRLQGTNAKDGVAKAGWFTCTEMQTEHAGAVFSELGEELAFKPHASGLNSGRRNSGVTLSKGLDAAGMSQLQAKKQFAHKAKSGVSTFETCYDDGSNTTDTGGLQMQRPTVEREGIKAISAMVTPELYRCRRWEDVALDDPLRVRLYDESTERRRIRERRERNAELLQAARATEGAEAIRDVLLLKVQGLTTLLKNCEARLKHKVVSEKRWELFGLAFVHKKFAHPELEDVTSFGLVDILTTFGSEADRTSLLTASERRVVVLTREEGMKRLRESEAPQEPKKRAKRAKVRVRRGKLARAKLTVQDGCVQLVVRATAIRATPTPQRGGAVAAPERSLRSAAKRGREEPEALPVPKQLRRRGKLVTAELAVLGGHVQLQLCAKPPRAAPKRARPTLVAEQLTTPLGCEEAQTSRSGRVLKRKTRWGDGDEDEQPASKWRSK